MSDFHFNYAMLKIFSMNAASISVMKLFAIGGIDLVQYSHVKYAKNDIILHPIILTSGGILMRVSRK